MSDGQRITFRLSDEAKHNLDCYCMLTGQKPAEVVRAGIAQIMAPYIGQIMATPRPVVQEPVQVEETKNRLEDDTETERKSYQKTFIASVANCKFPPRIAKAIKEQWEAIQESQIPAEILAELYGEYCRVEKSAGREHCHPNSWITNHGWLNENYDEGSGGPIYDTDR